MTEWKTIPNFKDFKINKFGRVIHTKSSFGKTIYKEILSHGKNYFDVRLNIASKRYTFYVHILVCTLFVGPKPSPLHEVNHKDGNKKNNYYKNLEWLTKSENALHRFKYLGHRSSNFGKT